MASTIQIKRGSGTPTTSNLAQYELAYDHATNKLYIHDPTNSSGQEIVEITGSTISTAAVANGASTLATGDHIYDFVTGLGYLTSVPNHSANLLTSGTVPLARISGLTTDNIAADAVIEASKLGDIPASKITSGTFVTSRIPDLAASKITSGTFAAARIPDSFLKNDASDTTSGTITAGGFTTAGSITIGGHSFNDIDIGSEFNDVDDHLMSSGAIKEKIEAYGYTTSSGLVSTTGTISNGDYGRFNSSGVMVGLSKTEVQVDLELGDLAALDTLGTGHIPNLPTSKITSGTFAVNRGGTGQTTLGSNLVLTGNGTSGITAEAYLSFDGTYLNIQAPTAVHRRMQFTDTTTGANAWHGLPSWDSDAWHFYGPTSSANELAYKYISSKHEWYNSGAVKMTLTGGSLGIGTESPAAWLDVSKDNSNSGNQFMVADTEGASAAVRTYTTSSPAGLILNHYYAVGGSPYMRYADFVANVGSGAATTMRFITKNSSNAYSTTVIDDGGNVGIGNVAPGYKLDVTGNGRFTADLRVEGRALSQNGSASAPSYSFNSQGNAGMYRNGTGLGFSANGAAKMLMSETFLDLGSGDFSIKKTGGNNTNNYAAVEVYSAGTGENQAAIAIQQQTSEGDTIIFADFEPHVEWGISADNSVDEIHFTGGSSTASLGTKTFKNNAGANRTAYKKMSVGLNTGNVSIGGTVTGASFHGDGSNLTGVSGAVSAVANGSNNRIATFSSSTALYGEDKFTFDGTHARLPDNSLFLFGAGDKFQIGHKATYSQIVTYEGHLYIDNNADDSDIVFRTDDGSNGLANYITLDGSTTSVAIHQDIKLTNTKKLYLDNGLDTYINEVTANAIGFTTAGAERMRIDTTGLGIGKTPSYKLDVNSTSAGIIAQFQYASDTDGRIQIYADANAGSIGNDTGLQGETIYFQDDVGQRFYTGGSERVRIDTSGHLTIQDGHLILPYGEINDSGTDVVIKATNAFVAQSGGANNRYVINSSGSHTFYGNVSMSSPLSSNYGPTFNEGGNDSDTRIESVGNANMFRLDASTNRIGIGTGSPAYDLHVAGHLYASSSFLGPDGSSGTPSYRFHNDGNSGMFSYAQDQLGFSTTGTTRMVINNNGPDFINTSGLYMDNRRFFEMRSNSNDRGAWNPIASNIRHSGVQRYFDEEFASGNNSVILYNNAGGSNLVLSRITASADSLVPPNSTGVVLKLAYNGSGTTSPNFGGIYQTITSEENHTFAQVFQAKLPDGRKFVINENAQGTRNSSYWMTSDEGTGKWEWYVRVSHCGDSGTFGGGGHISVSGGSDTAFNWYIASMTQYDVTEAPPVVQNITNQSNNRLLTSTGSYNGINAEPSITFDGTNLAFSGRLYLDGGGNTYIEENAADTIGFATNGSLRFTMNSGGDFYCSNKIQAGGNGVEIWDATHGFKQVIGKDSTYTKLLNNDGAINIHLGDTGDANNYYNNGGHRFRSSNGGTYFGALNSTGLRLGTGTSFASYRLDVAGDVRITHSGDQMLRLARSGANEFSLEIDSSRMYWYNRTTSTALFAIDNAGNFGVGTVSPTSKLHIYNGNGSIPDDANNHVLIEDDGHCYLGIGGGTSSDTGIHFMDSGGIRGRIAYHHNGDSMSFKTSNTERIRIDATGTKFSENFSSTDDILHIKPTNGGNRTMTIDGQIINVTYSNSTGSAALELQANGGATTFAGPVSGITTLNTTGGITTNYGLSLTQGATNFLLYNNANENVLYMRDTTNGAMLQTWGVSSTTIHKPLTVQGLFTGTQISLGYNHGNDYSIGCSNWFRSSGATGWYNGTYGGGIRMTDTTWVKLYNGKALYVANQIAATGDVTAYYSDERLKTKIETIDNAVDKVMSLEGFIYEENELAEELGYTNKGKRQVGVSAQQVEKVLPEAVTLAAVDMETDEFSGEITSKSGENYLTVKYEKLIPLLIESIKELKEEIDRLKTQIGE